MDLKPFLYRPPIMSQETLPSYLYRLAIANCHSPNLIREFVREQLYANDNFKRPSHHVTFQVLADLTGLEAYKLYWASEHSLSLLLSEETEQLEMVTLRTGMTYPQIPEAVVKRHLRRGNNAQYCPLCLQENVYQKRAWRMKAIACCDIHQCLLVDRCPQCQEFLADSDIMTAQCGRCGGSLLNADAQSVSHDYWGTKAQGLLYYLANAGPHVSLCLPFELPNELYSFAYGLMRKIFRINTDMQALHPIPTLSRPFDWKGNVSLSPAQYYVAWVTAMSALLDWPRGFHDFVDRYSYKDGKPYSTRMLLNMSSWLSGLLVKWPAEKSEVIHRGISDYIFANSTWFFLQKRGEVQDEIKEDIDSDHPMFQDFHWMIKKHAMKFLSVSEGTINRLIAQGVIRYKPESAQIRHKLLSVKDVLALKENWSRGLSLPEASLLLSASEDTVLDLLRNEMITAVSGPNIDGGSIWKIEQDSIERLLNALYNAPNRMGTYRRTLGVSLGFAAKILSRYHYSAAKVIALLLDEKLRFRIDNNKGLATISILKKALVNQLEKERAGGELVSLGWAAKRLHIRRGAVAELIQQNILKPASVNNRGVFFRRDEMESFAARHVSSREASEILEVSLLTVQTWTRAGRLQVVSGPGVDNRGVYLYARDGLEQLRAENRITLPEVAKLIGKSRSHVRLMISEGKITPFSGPGIDGCGRFLFLKDEVNL